MANWGLPTLTDLYTDFRQFISDRLDDAAKMFDSATTVPTNQPVGTKRWNSTSNKFEKWGGSAWSDLASTYGISISGNAATATTAGTAGSVTTVTSANITSGLGYTPLDKAGGTVTGALTVSGLITGGAGLTITGNMYASGTIRAAGAAQFYSTMTVSGAVTVGGAITSNGEIKTNNSAFRANGWGGDYSKGLIFFGDSNNNYIVYNNSNGYSLRGDSGNWVANINKGGIVAMTSDIVSKDQNYANVGSYVFAATAYELNPGDTISGAALQPVGVTNDGSEHYAAALSGTWRCLGRARSISSALCATLFQRIA